MRELIRAVMDALTIAIVLVTLVVLVTVATAPPTELEIVRPAPLVGPVCHV